MKNQTEQIDRAARVVWSRMGEVIQDEAMDMVHERLGYTYDDVVKEQDALGCDNTPKAKEYDEVTLAVEVDILKKIISDLEKASSSVITPYESTTALTAQKESR